MDNCKGQSIQGILYLGWIHPRNEEGIKFLTQTLGLQLHKLANQEEIDTYKGKWIVLSLNQPISNNFQHKLVISGPHYHPINNQTPKLIFNTLSPWITEMIRHEPIERTIAIPFPINYNYLQPTTDLKTTVIFYAKNRPPHIIEQIQIKLQTIANVRYFNYNHHYEYSDWIDALKTAKLCILLIGSESQGFAVQEAMAMDVPLLVLDCQFWNDAYPMDPHIHYYQERNNGNPIKSTSVNIWTDNCGIKTTMESFDQDLRFMLEHSTDFHPRIPLLVELNCQHIWEKYCQLYEELRV